MSKLGNHGKGLTLKGKLTLTTKRRMNQGKERLVSGRTIKQGMKRSYTVPGTSEWKGRMVCAYGKCTYDAEFQRVLET